MDAQHMFLDLEICLSDRSDLILPVLRRLLCSTSSAKAGEETTFFIRAHAVSNAAVVKLNFLIDGTDKKSLRSQLIVLGETALDNLFSASPWHGSSLIVDVNARPKRAEIYAKCSVVDDGQWFGKVGATTSARASIVSLITQRLRALHLEGRSLKSVLPLLVNYRVKAETGPNWSGPLFSESTASEMRCTLLERVATLRQCGDLLVQRERLGEKERLLLNQLQELIWSVEREVGAENSLITLRSLLGQLGLSDLEADYVMLLGTSGTMIHSEQMELA